jgi:hypothetical protein
MGKIKYRNKIVLTILLYGFLSFNCYAKGNKEVDYLYETIEIDTNIDYDENLHTKILIKTKDGCSESGFKIKNIYYDENEYIDNTIVISTFEEFIEIKYKYFELPFLETISENYFEENQLVLILKKYVSGENFRNERIEQRNNKFVLVIENWRYYPRRNASVATCLYIGLYILQI